MDIIQLRRDLHKHPELGFTEFRTASKIVEKLESLGYKTIYGADATDKSARKGVPAKEVIEGSYERALRDGANPTILEKMRGGLTSVIGILEGKTPGPTIAFRFDIDALPITESSEEDHLPYEEGFRSAYEGTMHACAHDGHTAIGLGLAEAMVGKDFSGRLMVIFQAAEEGGRGAYAIAQKGILDDVDKIYCFHLGLDVPQGEVAGGSEGWLASTKLLAHFHGTPSHAGLNPEKGNNALLGAATAVLNIHGLPRHSQGLTRVNVGILESGTALNITPQYAKMAIETRADSGAVNSELESRVRQIIESSASMHGLQYDISVTGESIPISCDEELATTALEEAVKIQGFNSFKETHHLSAGEDASFLIKRVQDHGGKGTYMIIGTKLAAPHHHQKFDIEEQVLLDALKLVEQIATRELS